MEEFYEDFPLLANVQEILDTERRLDEIRNYFRVPRTILRDQLNVMERYNAQKFK